MGYDTWHIIEADCLFNDSKKVSIEQIKDFWNEGTIMVCRKVSGSRMFVVGDGPGGGYANIGDVVESRHDQTCRKISNLIVENVIDYTELATAVGNRVGLNEKRRVYVFK